MRSVVSIWEWHVKDVYWRFVAVAMPYIEIKPPTRRPEGTETGYCVIFDDGEEQYI